MDRKFLKIGSGYQKGMNYLQVCWAPRPPPGTFPYSFPDYFSNNGVLFYFKRILSRTIFFNLTWFSAVKFKKTAVIKGWTMIVNPCHTTQVSQIINICNINLKKWYLTLVVFLIPTKDLHIILFHRASLVSYQRCYTSWRCWLVEHFDGGLCNLLWLFSPTLDFCSEWDFKLTKLWISLPYPAWGSFTAPSAAWRGSILQELL